MNIGIDIDDTITNTFDYLMPYIAEYFNTDIKYLKTNNISYSNLPEEWKKKEFELAKTYYDKVILNTPIKLDAVKYIKKIKELKHSIIIITARNTNMYVDPYKLSTEQLKKHGIYYDKLICSFDKAKVCMEENIDLLIDDSIYNCELTNKLKIETLLFNCKSNNNIETRLTRVNNWKEVYDYIYERSIIK